MTQRRNKSIWMPVIIALILVLGIFIGITVGRGGTRSQLRSIARDLSGTNNKISYTLSLIDKYYVDEVSIDSLVEELMPQLMAELDPHSVYIPKEDMPRLNESLDGEFEGIGVVFNMTTDTIIVLNVVPHGPSQKAGMQNGDRIIKINDSLVAGQKIRQDDIMKMLRGKRGTQVDVAVQRQGITSLVPLSIIRDKIPIKSVDAAFMLQPGTAFLKLSAFSRTSHDEIRRALDSLRGAGAENVILDLRGNSGGFMDQAIMISNDFLTNDQLIVYTMDRHGNKTEQFTDGKGAYQDVNLAVLIDESSASSSEILAGAIQDNDRGVIIGRRSFGKGLVQQAIPFADGSSIRLTISRYYTPAGRSIQKPYGHGEEYDSDLLNRYLHNEMFSADSIRFADTLQYKTSGGRTVYGGGGIMPDIFVPIDTTDMTQYYFDVVGGNIVYRYALEYADKHRDAMNRITSVAELNALLDGDKDLFDDFVAYASRNGVKPKRKQIATSRKTLNAQIRAMIGRNTPLEDEGFYSNIYPIDHALLRALEYFEKED